MRSTLRRDPSIPWLLPLTCALAAVAACGGGAGQGQGTTTGQFSGTGAGGAAGRGSATTTTGSGTGSGGSIDLDGGGKQVLTLSPATATIVVASKVTPATQVFQARIDGVPVATAVSWTLDSYAEGTIDAHGAFTTTGLVGGQVTVTAGAGALKATALLTVEVHLEETVTQGPTDPGLSAQDKTALLGVPQPDPGAGANPPNPTKILYPYDKTVMPRGLVAPVLQWSPGNLPPADGLLTLSSTFFSYKGLFHVLAPATPQFAVPQDVWDAALLSTGGKTLTIELTKAAAGKAYGPAKSAIEVAAASLLGAVYYMTYDTPGEGLYSVLPGVKKPATQIAAGCLVCHSVSANGTKLSLGTDDANLMAQSGIYDVGANGKATQLTQSPPGLGGDTRGISFASFTPDGKFVMRSQDNFWGGPNQEAWAIDDVNKKLTPATVVGLGAGVSAYVPAIAPDGKHYAFTNGAGEAVPFGTVSRSVSLMDLVVDANTNTLTFSNRKLLVDNGPGGSVTKFVTFLPDPSYLVLEEGENFCASYGEMLPTWDATCGDYSYGGATGRLYLLDAKTKGHEELAILNAGNVASDRQRNFEPFALQVTAGGYFWIVFTSIREYGNTYTGSAVRKQLWVAALSTSPAPGQDPSHPPFYLPNQSATRNERGYWALSPCKKDGATCETGDECCDGFCRPSDPSNPASPKVCKPPVPGGCSQVAEKCTTAADCCGQAVGVTCVGGFCTPKSPT